MNSIPHIMVSHGAGVTRTNNRWPPYTLPCAPETRDVLAFRCTGLADQALQTISQIWGKEITVLVGQVPPPHSQRQPSQLTSSPNTTSEKDLRSLKTFIQKVLFRSGATLNILQLALCYIEAVRKIVPELVEKENMCTGLRGKPGLDERLVKEGDPSSSSNIKDTACHGRPPTELMSMAPFDGSGEPVAIHMDATLPMSQHHQVQAANGKQRKTRAKPLTPLPSLPTPLLCPRRTFLAALILATKFLNDKCYSNIVWAKAFNLPPREVGRCERALGNALGWRLWVGKCILKNEENSCVVQRTKSESVLELGVLSMPPALSLSHFLSPPTSDVGASPESGCAHTKVAGVVNRALRCHTAMDEDTVV